MVVVAVMGRDRASAAATAVVTLWWLAGGAGAVWLELATTAAKCLSEEIQSRVVVIGDYILYEDHPVRPKVCAKVTSPYGKVLHHSDNVTEGQFAFTTEEPGIYLACFWVEPLERGTVPLVNLNLDWRIGIAARDWNAIAKKEKLEGVELEILKLEAAVQAVLENLLYLRSKEADMRDLSEWTNIKVVWLSLMSLTVCIVVSILQLLHLKQLFRKKRLI